MDATGVRGYLAASGLGAARGAFGLIFEHPFDVVKTELQARPKGSSIVHVAQSVYRQKGWQGFYSGFTPSCIRATVKHAYRWPLIMFFPGFFDRYLQHKHSTVSKACTGLVVASVDSLVLTPIEHAKVRMIRHYSVTGSLRHFLSVTGQNPRAELFRGLNAVYPRQVVSWVTFLVSDKKAKDTIRSFRETEELSAVDLFAVSGIVASINTLATMPFDLMKTRLQMESLPKKQSVVKAASYYIKKYGVRALWRGWQVRLMQFFIHSFFTVTLLERLERNTNPKAR